MLTDSQIRQKTVLVALHYYWLKVTTVFNQHFFQSCILFGSKKVALLVDVLFKLIRNAKGRMMTRAALWWNSG